MSRNSDSGIQYVPPIGQNSTQICVPTLPLLAPFEASALEENLKQVREGAPSTFCFCGPRDNSPLRTPGPSAQEAPATRSYRLRPCARKQANTQTSQSTCLLVSPDRASLVRVPRPNSTPLFSSDHPRAPSSPRIEELRKSQAMATESSAVYEPILPTTDRKQSRGRVARWRPSYGGFEHQKRVWEATKRRSARIRIVAALQLVLGVLCSWNYLWLTNIFGAFVGFVGLKAVRSDKMSWTIVYLLVCAMEFARNVMLAPHIYERYTLPNLVFTRYEYFQVAVMALQVGFLIPAAFCIVFAATASLANPLW